MIPAVPPIYYNSLVLIDRGTNLSSYYSEPLNSLNIPLNFVLDLQLKPLIIHFGYHKWIENQFVLI
jgi:hypothetical protein